MRTVKNLVFTLMSLGFALLVNPLFGQSVQKITQSTCEPYYPRELVDKIIFMGKTNGSGLEPWVCQKDGSGAQMIKDIKQGTGSCMDGPFADRNDLRTLNQYALFFANDGFSGKELWKTDGTLTGTSIVKEIGVGSNGANGQFTSVTPLNGHIIFYANDGSGFDLWKTDGTEAGTSKISNLKLAIAPYIPYIYAENNHLVYNNKLFLIINEKLYAIDGSTFSLELLESGGSWTPAYVLIPFNNKVYFFRQMGGYASMWETDGTLSNTRLVKDRIYSAPVNGNTLLPQSFGVASDVFYLEMKKTTNGKTYTSELWKSDGTSAGTVFVKSFYSSLNDMMVINNKVFFTAFQDKQMNGVWVSYGTEANTSLVFNFELNTSFSAGTWWSAHFRNYRDSLLFNVTTQTRYGVYLTDGTNAGTRRIMDFNGVSDVFVGNSVLYVNALADIYRYPGYTSTNHVDMMDEEISCKVYPNPTNGVLNINLNEPFNATLYTMDGRTVYSSINDNVLDISHLKSGNYRLEIVYKRGVIHRMILRQ